MSNRWVFKWDQKTVMEGVQVMCPGKLFQTQAAATGIYITHNIQYG